MARHTDVQCQNGQTAMSEIPYEVTSTSLKRLPTVTVLMVLEYVSLLCKYMRG